MFDSTTVTELYYVFGMCIAVSLWFLERMKYDVLEEEMEELTNAIDDKQVLINLLSKANIDWEEWNEWVIAIDDGYIQAIFNRDGSLRELRSAGE
tara:strand:+ start:1983 stop:2267 length:285 start_codon:yes stop_codon:yes gene_type:complete